MLEFEPVVLGAPLHEARGGEEFGPDGLVDEMVSVPILAEVIGAHEGRGVEDGEDGGPCGQYEVLRLRRVRTRWFAGRSVVGHRESKDGSRPEDSMELREERQPRCQGEVLEDLE